MKLFLTIFSAIIAAVFAIGLVNAVVVSGAYEALLIPAMLAGYVLFVFGFEKVCQALKGE